MYNEFCSLFMLKNTCSNSFIHIGPFKGIFFSEKMIKAANMMSEIFRNSLDQSSASAHIHVLPSETDCLDHQTIGSNCRTTGLSDYRSDPNLYTTNNNTSTLSSYGTLNIHFISSGNFILPSGTLICMNLFVF